MLDAPQRGACAKEPYACRGTDDKGEFADSARRSKRRCESGDQRQPSKTRCPRKAARRDDDSESISAEGHGKSVTCAQLFNEWRHALISRSQRAMSRWS